MRVAMLVRLACSLCLLCSALAQGGDGVGAMVWVYRCDNNASSYQSLIDYLIKHGSNGGVSSVSFCPYRITAEGTFGYQTSPYGPEGCGENQEKFGIAQMVAAKSSLKQYPLIDNHAGIESLRLMMNSTLPGGRREQFIKAAVAKMNEQQFHGYNLDIELSGTEDDADLYAAFVDEFAQALHAAGGRLSSDMGQCGPTDGYSHRDYIGMRCNDYYASTIDSVATMSTYTHDFSTFRTIAYNASKVLTHGMFRAGLSNDIPDALVGKYFAYLTSLDVHRAAIWACSHPPCWNTTFAEAMSKWAQTAANKELPAAVLV